MTDLYDKQVRFLRYLARLIQFAESMGWELTMGEGHVADTDAADGDYDGPHMQGGTHYNRIGIDLNLFVAKAYKATSCPEWTAMGQFWKSLSTECAWGGDFPGDLNHFSVRYRGKA